MDWKLLRMGVLCALVMLLGGCWSSSTRGETREGGARDSGVEAALDGGLLVDTGALEEPAALPTLEEFLVQRRAVRCAWRVQCDVRSGTSAACHPLAPDRWEQVRFEGVRGGTIRYDEGAARSCLETLARAVPGCDSQMLTWAAALGGVELDDPTGIEAACRAVFSGALEEGAACRPGECRDGLSCQVSAAGGAGGRCQVSAVAADRASRGDRCDTEGGLFCVDGLWCVRDLCVERSGEGTACATSGECRSPLVCLGGTCGAGGAEGEPCDLGAGTCAADLLCLGEAGASTCRSTAGTRAGDACYALERFLGSTCRGNLHCAEESPDVPEGAEGWGVCVAGTGAGSPCDDHRSCGRGLVCAAGSCQRAVVPGGLCDVDAQCPPLHGCDRGHCQPLPGPGDACEDEVGCLWGRCSSGVCCLVPSGGACTFERTELGMTECHGVCYGDGRCGASHFACGNWGECWPDVGMDAPACMSP